MFTQNTVTAAYLDLNNFDTNRKQLIFIHIIGIST